MDEIFIIPKISTYTFGKTEIKEYTDKNFQHPYIEKSLPHPTKEETFNHFLVHFEFFLNRRSTYYSINSDVLFYNVIDWHDSHYKISNFHPFAIYLDEIIYQQPVSFKCSNDFILWDISPTDIQTLKITNKSNLIFNKNQYKNCMKSALERLFILPEISNIPADKIFLPDDENIPEFKDRLLDKNI